MTQWGIDTLFNPGKRHMDEEKRRLQSTREEVGDSSGGRRIDLESGTVTISRRGKAAPPADPAAQPESDEAVADESASDAAEAGTAEAETDEAETDEAESTEAGSAEADSTEADSTEAEAAEVESAEVETAPRH